MTISLSWPAGPWDSEPEQDEWIDTDTDYPCHAWRNNFGAWCGYVGVSPDHPLFGASYDDVAIEVHGGLTFAGFKDDDGYYYFGFDCAHAHDFVPGMSSLLGTYRTLDYVKAEIASLAKQLEALKNVHV